MSFFKNTSPSETEIQKNHKVKLLKGLFNEMLIGSPTALVVLSIKVQQKR
tara:strand:- start:6872 stop:7021 length:150 start_codon:yes stop_codon:yes gene_type:complete